MHAAYRDGNHYHVYNRGVHRSTIFFSDENYRYCHRLLAKNAVRYGVSVMAYCLMRNHYHLVLRQGRGGSITGFLRTTFNAYVQSVNRREAMSGTLFERSAQGLYIPGEKALAAVVSYVHLNPVRAGLVQTPEVWDFSDCRRWIGDEPFAGMAVRDALFGSGREYLEFLRFSAGTEPPSEGLKPW